jgi:hypothetical protein
MEMRGKTKKTTFLTNHFIVMIIDNKNILRMFFKDTDNIFGNAWKTQIKKNI